MDDRLLKTLKLMILLSFAFGFLALIIEGSLAFVIAYGKVEQQTSYGLLNVLGSLNNALGTFVGFTFGSPLWQFVTRLRQGEDVKTTAVVETTTEPQVGRE